MAYTVLARRYRSNTFDEVVGQNHVAQTLKKAIATDRIAHAYLFTGTRGVGKTSMARILAKALNCEKATKPTTDPCGKCGSCQGIARGEDIDVIEIDAASNRGIDEVRRIIENAVFRPARSRFKIFIIDEVHAMTKDAFHALLKVLEEPPEHVKFILATTEPERVLATIHSRCQRYDFRNIPTREIAGHLKAICKDEGIKADDDALMLVAKAGAGSMRDSLSLLDRLLSIGEKKVTVETVEQSLGLPRSQAVFNLAEAIGLGRTKDVLSQAHKLVSEGLSADTLVVSLTDHFRDLLVLRTCGAESELVEAAAVSLEELAKQAERFDAVTLTQDITILEELRRQMHQSQAGRALLDATLVRLALADQFTAIGELLGQVDGRGMAAAQKKTPDVVAGHAPPYLPSRLDANVSMVQPGEGDPWVAPTETKGEASPTPADDEEDELPRPGKVWEGPSLKELLRQTAVPAPAPAAVPGEAEPNVPGCDAGDAPGVWRALLAALKDRAGVHALIAHGQLGEIADDQAVIRFTPENESFMKMLARNGKKELVGEALTQIRGKATGVRFEVEAGAVAAAPGVEPAAPSSAPRGAPVAGAAPSQPEGGGGSGRITPEQAAEFEQDPLIRGLLTEFGATMLKISQE